MRSPIQLSTFNFQLSLFLFLLLPFTAVAADDNIDYTAADSLEVCSWLREAQSLPGGEPAVIWFGRKFLGRPYVAHTLERNATERLVVNTRELDCTTFTENVAALELCRRNGKTAFSDFCHYLRLLRYEQGKSISYTSRNHYFTGWIASNVSQGFFSEITRPASLFRAVQRVRVDYMTAHASAYKMLRDDPSLLPGIREMEQRVSGGAYPYIPKSALKRIDTEECRDAIHDGDIIVILTNKAGLDTQHITLAYWHTGALHIMHASSLRKKVVDEPLTLYEYLMRQKSATGIRVLRMNGL